MVWGHTPCKPRKNDNLGGGVLVHTPCKPRKNGNFFAGRGGRAWGHTQCKPGKNGTSGEGGLHEKRWVHTQQYKPNVNGEGAFCLYLQFFLKTRKSFNWLTAWEMSFINNFAKMTGE